MQCQTTNHTTIMTTMTITITTEEEKIIAMEQEQERQRMLCGKCDKCKAVGVKLNPHGIWDLCDKCSPKKTSKKK